MIKRFCYLILLIFIYASGNAQSVLPDDVVIDQKLDYTPYTRYVIPAINWLQTTPLNKDREQRKRLDNFIMYWLQRNEEVIITMPEYLVKFQTVENEMYFLYAGGAIKYVMLTKDTNSINKFLAGVHSMLDYYKADMGVRKNDYMDYLVQLDKQGKLDDLYDTRNGANNTHLYLRNNYTKHAFEPDENYFSFHFTAINFTDPKSLQCRYKLEGYYDEWIPTADELVIFPKLPPGNYRFRVQASLTPDFAAPVERSYSFSIASPLWQSWWFIASGVLLAGLIIYWYTRQREQGLKNVGILQQQRMMLEYDHLRSQINPHFLFNSLNTLTSLIEEDPQNAVLYSENLSDLYRNVLAYRSEDLVYLFEEMEILEHYIHIQKSRFGEGLKVQLNIPEEVQRDKKIVPLALQLLVENAMKHNVVSKSNPLTVWIVTDGDYISVINNIQPKISKEKGVGLGLENIRKRYELATNKQIYYGNQNNDYVVKLPLL